RPAVLGQPFGQGGEAGDVGKEDGAGELVGVGEGERGGVGRQPAQDQGRDVTGEGANAGGGGRHGAGAQESEVRSQRSEVRTEASAGLADLWPLVRPTR